MTNESAAWTRRAPARALKLTLATAVLGLGPLGAAPTAAQEPTLDESCIVSVLNRTAPVDAAGVWVLPNVPARIGQVRLRATCVEDGVTRGGQSDFFTVPPDGVIRVSEIHFESPAPVPERLVLSASSITLNEAGQVMPLGVQAIYPDGATADVAPAAAGTNYIVSNPAVATVSPDGAVTAVTSGTVIVTALNEGATGFLRLKVVLSGDSDGDGIPDDVEVSLGLDPNDSVDALSDPDEDGLTTGEEIALGTDPDDPDSDGDGLLDGEEVTLTGTDPALFDTDGDGLSDGLEIATGSDPLDPTSFNLAEALASFRVRPASFVLNTNTVLPGEAFVSLTVEGTLIDGNTIDLSSSARGTGYSSSDLLICNFGLEPGVVFGGAEGACTITATNSGFTAAAEGLVQAFTPAPVSGLPLPSYGNSVAVRDGWAFVAGGPGGLHVIDVSRPLVPRIVTTLPLPGNANDIALEGELAYIAGGEAGVHVVDVSVPAVPVLVATADTPGSAIALRVAGTLAYVADGAEGLQVISVENPASPLAVGSWDTPGEANGLAVAGGLAVLSTLDAPLELIDVSTPSAPVGLSTLSVPDRTYDVEILGAYAYVATSNDLRVVDVSDPQAPVDQGAFGPGSWMIDLLAAQQDRIFTTEVDPRARMPIFDLRQDPAAPFFAGAVLFSDLAGGVGNGIHLAVDGPFVYMTATSGSSAVSKPGTSGATRLLIGQHAPFEDLVGQPPQVSVLLPEDGAEVPEETPFEVVIEAADDIGVLDVTLLVDGEVFARDAVPPYRFLVQAPSAPSALRLGAFARDFGANHGEAEKVDLQVVGGAGSTTVVGQVRTAQGDPIGGASVFTSLGGSSVTSSDGSFSIEEVPVVGPSLVAFAAAEIDGKQLRGRSESIAVVGGGMTDVGPIVLEPVGLPYPGARSSMPAGAEVLAAADFDQDGLLDLAALPDGIGLLTVFFGRGDGSFGRQVELSVGSDPPAGSNPEDLKAADVNLDGFPDLIVATRSSKEIRAILGHGDGTFAPSIIYSTSIDPAGLAVGDVNRDLLPDILVAGETSTSTNLLVFLGSGDGAFEEMPPVPFPASPIKVHLADFDGDGKLDLVTRRNLVVALGNGDGSFQTGAALLPTSTVLDHQVEDLNGDSLPDILVLEQRPNLGNQGTAFLSRGDGSFEEIWAWTHLTNPGVMTVGDLNLDGIPDALVNQFDLASSATGIRPLLGDGTGAFLSVPLVPGGDQTGRVLLADFDGDSIGDLAVAGHEGVNVFSGLGTGGFRSYQRDRTFGLFDDTPSGKQFAVGDVDMDGIEDLVISSGKSVKYYQRNPDRSIGESTSFTLSHVPEDLKIVDLDRDGAPEVVTVGISTVSVLHNRGDGTFSGPEEQVADVLLTAVIAAELTGDGFIDLAVVSRSSFTLKTNTLGILENDGSGSFAPARSYSLGSTPVGLVALDFDLDGDLDLALRGGGAPVTLMANDGSGNFSLAGSIQVAFPSGITADDLDGDGLWDLVTVSQPTGQARTDLTVFLGLGAGQFSQGRQYPVGSRARQVIVFDVDFDGVRDLITLNQESQDISWLRGLGDGTFAAEQRFAVDGGALRFSLIDADGDGLRDDLVIGGSNRLNFIHHQ